MQHFRVTISRSWSRPSGSSRSTPLRWMLLSIHQTCITTTGCWFGRKGEISARWSERLVVPRSIQSPTNAQLRSDRQSPTGAKAPFRDHPLQDQPPDRTGSHRLAIRQERQAQGLPADDAALSAPPPMPASLPSQARRDRPLLQKAFDREEQVPVQLPDTRPTAAPDPNRRASAAAFVSAPRTDAARAISAPPV